MTAVDSENAAFWSELCGTSLATALGITSDDPDALGRFDSAYLGLYPYLLPYVDRLPLDGPILEIGLGYGTLAQYLMDTGVEYRAIDIAEGPVRMVRHRARLAGHADAEVVKGSCLDLPWQAETFVSVVSIGCLHHTGDLPRAVQEVYRVLQPDGVALVMLYNRHSLRQLVQAPLVRLRARGGHAEERVRAMYDANADGTAAPHTDYVSRRDVRQLFSSFATIEIEARNFDPIILPRGRVIPRERLLGNVDRLLGLDLYIVARK